MKLKKAFISKEVSPYFSPYTVRKVQLLESSERTKKLLEGIHMGEQLSMLVTALDMLVGSDSLQYFNALLYGFNQTPQHKSVKMYESAGNVVEAMVPNELLVELKQIITISKAEEHGFIYDEKRNSYYFNVNIFVKHFEIEHLPKVISQNKGGVAPATNKQLLRKIKSTLLIQCS